MLLRELLRQQRSARQLAAKKDQGRIRIDHILFRAGRVLSGLTFDQPET